MKHIKACHEKTVLWQCWTSVSFCKLKHATYHIYTVDVSLGFVMAFELCQTQTRAVGHCWSRIFHRLTRDDGICVSWWVGKAIWICWVWMVFHLGVWWISMDKNGSFLQIGIARTSFDGFGIPFDRFSALSNFLAQPLVTATCKKKASILIFPCFDLNPTV